MNNNSKFKLKLGENKCSNEDYHADRTFYSSSVLKILLKDKLKFYNQYILGYQPVRKAVDAFAFGSYVHTLILEPELAGVEYAIAPADVKVRRGKKYEDFKNAPSSQGKTILTETQRDLAEKLIDSYDNCSPAVNLIKGGEPEKTLCVHIDGIPIKVRGDYVNTDKGYIVDVKTTAGATDKYAASITNDKWEYPLSATLYTMAFEEHYGMKFDFYWVYLSKSLGTCDVFKMSDATRAKGEEQIRKAFDIYRQNAANDSWETPDELEYVKVEPYEIEEI